MYTVDGQEVKTDSHSEETATAAATEHSSSLQLIDVPLSGRLYTPVFLFIRRFFSHFSESPVNPKISRTWKVLEIKV